MIRLLALDGRLFNDTYISAVKAGSPLTQDLPVHSTVVVTTTLVELGPAHVIHVLVLTLNTPPLGTSGVLVVVIIVTY